MLFLRPALSSWSRLLCGSALALLLGLSVTHCGAVLLGDEESGQDLGPEQPKQLRYLSVTPDNEVLQVDLNQTQQRTFKVVAHYSNSTTADVSGLATVTLANAGIGALSGLTFTSAASPVAKVGFSKVEASYTEDGQTALGYANLTVVWLRLTGTATDFFFKLPYMGGSQDQPLQFGTNVQSLDSFFAVDTTGSMGPEIHRAEEQPDQYHHPRCESGQRPKMLSLE
jgi:hypothetical protein